MSGSEDVELTGDGLFAPINAPPLDLAARSGSGLVPTTANGSYRLLAVLGRGGMGDVYLAERRGGGGSSKLVVVKQLRPSLVAEPEFLKMFLHEGHLGVRLDHPNIVQCHEVGIDAEGRYFIAMEYLEGQSFSRLFKRAVERGDALPLSLTLQALMAVLDGLHYAHEMTNEDGSQCKIVHRDVSPQNIFVTYHGECKLLDFGIAKASSSPVHTQHGVFKGKMRYMSPEQVIGDPVDRRGDLFSAGIILWSILTGHSPWEGLSNLDIANRLISGKVPQVDAINEQHGEALAAVCKKALAFSADERFATAREMREALQPIVDALPEAKRLDQLGEIATKLFLDERRLVRQTVDAQLRAGHLLAMPGALSLPSLHGASTVSAFLKAPGSATGASTVGSERGSIASQSLQTDASMRRQLQVGIVVAIALALVAIGFGVAASFKERAAGSVFLPVVSVQPPPTGNSTANPKTFEIDLSPNDAQLMVNGSAVRTPFGLTGAPDGQAYALTVSAPGYATVSQTVIFDAPRHINIILQSLGTTKAPGPAARATALSRSASNTAGTRGVPAAKAPKPRRGVNDPASKPRGKESKADKIDVLSEPVIDVLE